MVTKNYRGVQFFSIVDGKFKIVTIIGIDVYVDDIEISSDIVA